jgi:hypothetical protein
MVLGRIIEFENLSVSLLVVHLTGPSQIQTVGGWQSPGRYGFESLVLMLQVFLSESRLW